MYSALPAQSTAATGLSNWGLRRAARMRFAEPSALSQNDNHLGLFREYVGDMLAPFALELGEFAGRGQWYGEMAVPLIRQVVPEGEEVDLLILAYAIPDITPGRATAAYLSHACPGSPLAFGISDQGTATAFTGLRLAREYARTGGCRRVLLIIAEQNDLPYHPGIPATVPAANAAVALLFGDAPVASLDTIDVRTQPVESYVDSPKAQPFTEVWWELAGSLQGNSGEQIVVSDRDPQLGYVCHAVFTVQ